MFVNRTEEKNRLNATLNGALPSFIIVYGRRRVGKSTLLKNVLTNKDVYYMADQTERSHQLQMLASDVALKFDGFDQVVYPDWLSLFVALNHRTNQKFTLCIDEFPYLAKSSPELPAVLQKLIDSKTLKYNIVLCGSSQQLMKGLFLDSSSALYGRADQTLKIQPLSIKYLGDVIACSALEAVEEYSVWGGIPRYWEIRRQSKSLPEAIRQNILHPQGVLFEEPYRLLIDDMRDIVQASTILSIVGNGANRLSEIASRANKPATSLSGPLEKLVNLGYLKKEIPFGENPRNSKKSLYRLADPFIDFYFRFVVPNRSLIELGRTDAVWESLQARFNGYVASNWESICRQAVSGQVFFGKRYGLASRWWGAVSKNKHAEIDIVALSTDEKSLLVGECKWTENENTNLIFDQLLEKAKILPMAAAKEIVPVLFLKTNTKTAENIFFPKHIINLF